MVSDSEQAYEPRQLIGEEETFQRVEAVDDEGHKVEWRTALYDSEDRAEVVARRSLLRHQYRCMEALDEVAVVPSALAWFEVDDSPVEMGPEPVLQCERIEGPTLYEWMKTHAPDGVAPERALEWVDAIAEMVEAVHDKGWLWRDFDPRGWVVLEDEELRPWSVSAALRKGPGPGSSGAVVNEDYTAPEVRRDEDGTHRKATADIYGLGALLSFLLSGIEPRHRVESPVSYPAYERIQEQGLAGLELLLGATLQPLADKRLGQMEQLRAHLSVETLPTENSEEFADKHLPAPWIGLELDDPGSNRGLRSNISSGPLVSMSSESAPAKTPGAARAEDEEAPALHWPTLLIMGGIIALALAWVLLN